jgi:hypothetical protein
MGAVWVSPPKFTDAQTGKRYVGQARALGLEASGNRIDLAAAWQPSDPGMVRVSPNPGHMVQIIVLKPGQSEVTVTAGGISRKLIIRASYANKATHVEITQ